MIQYVKQKLWLFIPTLLGATLFSFILGIIAPSDPALVILTLDGVSAPTAQEIIAKRHELGLDQPVIVQYAQWLHHILVGDWGASYITNKPVLTELLESAKVTISLASLSILFVICIAIPLGIIMAAKANSKTDKALKVFSIVLTSVPSFWIAIIAIQVLCENLRLFPTSGYGSIIHLILPALLLGITSVGLLMRIQRDSLYKVLQENYFTTALAKGLPYWYAIYHHAIKNSLISVVTLLGNYLAAILGGAAIIEIIFALPGLGTLVLEAIRARDYPMIQGYVLMIGAITIIINLIVDMIYVWLQPKIRYGGDSK